jgi:predicted DNA-binding ribbon-helix-helix protein
MITSASANLIKRSIKIAGKRTSVALEPQFWAELERIARARGTTLPRLLADIDKKRDPQAALASALRVFALLNPPPETPWARS